MSDVPDYLKPQLDKLDSKIEESKILLEDPDFVSLAEEELKALEAQKIALLSAVSGASESDDSEAFNTNGAILEIRGAAGGDEAKIWASDLLRMYIRFIEGRGWKYQPLEELSLKVKGKGCFDQLQYEAGVHRVQRIPETEKNGRIHTSTASVAVLPIIPPTQIEIHPNDLEVDFSRAGGHGGQNVNKVSTAVRMRHIPTGIIVECRQERTQIQNRQIAEELLRAKLWELEEEKRISQIENQRSAAVGRGMRSEKIRTYNYPQNRVTDHRINQSWYDLTNIMEGRLEKILEALQRDSAEEILDSQS